MRPLIRPLIRPFIVFDVFGVDGVAEDLSGGVVTDGYVNNQ